MKDECSNDERYPWKYFQGNMDATSASYFDDRCGIIYKDNEDLNVKFSIFMEKLKTFRPREFVVGNLSVNKFMKLLRTYV